jgi:hypothetical protein
VLERRRSSAASADPRECARSRRRSRSLLPLPVLAREDAALLGEETTRAAWFGKDSCARALPLLERGSRARRRVGFRAVLLLFVRARGGVCLFVRIEVRLDRGTIEAVERNGRGVAESDRESASEEGKACLSPPPPLSPLLPFFCRAAPASLLSSSFHTRPKQRPPLAQLLLLSPRWCVVYFRAGCSLILHPAGARVFEGETAAAQPHWRRPASLSRARARPLLRAAAA